MNRIQIIQMHIDKYGYKNYLEIGVQAGHCFREIKCENKTGVDPDTGSAATIYKTSDEFFDQNDDGFDLIFIDGLHHADQVYRDILNSLDCLNEGGVIFMHDCKPESEFMQLIPLTTQNEWTGDTWKAYIKARMELSNINFKVVNTDWGVGILKPTKFNKDHEKLIIDNEINYENLKNNEEKWLNLISVQTFLDSMQ